MGSWPLAHLEVANALLVAERRSVIAPGKSDLFLSRLNQDAGELGVAVYS